MSARNPGNRLAAGGIVSGALLLRVFLFLLLLESGCSLSACAGEQSDQQVLELLSVEQPGDRAIRRALEYLRGQQRADGSASATFPVALTGLAIMAHLAAGVDCKDPQQGAWLKKSLRYVLAQQNADGYFGQRDNSRMYGHGIVTLMLAEALGMIGEEDLEEQARRALERAVALTVRAARVSKGTEHAGGWRYEPGSGDSDLSLSGWQVMSLHAAQQVGVEVPPEVIVRAYEYARRNVAEDGRVGYQGKGSEHSPALRGLGMLVFSIAGRGDDPLVSTIGERIIRESASWNGDMLFYRIYYDAVGMSRARPELWEKYGPALVEILVKNQAADGSWPVPPGSNEQQHGIVYMVSMAALALAVDRHVLPAYQR